MRFLRPVEDLELFKDVPFAKGVRFRQILVTGPPGCGKTTLVRSLGGWPQEGFVDLSVSGWWRSRILTYRPREVHLLLPFRGYPQGMAHCDDEYLAAPPPLHLDLDRIALPPVSRWWSPVKWREKYCFEFIVPTAEFLSKVRAERAKSQSHPIDDDLTFARMQESRDHYETVAYFLHCAGMTVYVREKSDSVPYRFEEPAPWDQPAEERTAAPASPTLTSMVLRVFGEGRSQEVVYEDHIQLRGRRTLVPFDRLPLGIRLGAQPLEIHTEPLLCPPEDGQRCLVVFDPKEYSRRTSAFVRLTLDQSVRIGKGEEDRPITPRLPDQILPRLELRHESGGLAITDLESPNGTSIESLAGSNRASYLLDDRRAQLNGVREIYGGPLLPLSTEAATDRLRECLAVLEDSKTRPRDQRGSPGGLEELPAELTPIIVGDLHARVDNLLTILSRGRSLDEMISGAACLVLLGDLVHSEQDGQLEEMDSSILILDLVLTLLSRLPGRVVYLRGNHEGFSSDVRKCSVPQGLLWRRALAERRGEAFCQLVDRFYAALPILVCSTDFVACHAGPPLESLTREQLINLKAHPRLEYQLQWNRLRRPTNPAGYTKREVRALRAALGLSRDATMLVSHNPAAPGECFRLDLSGIRGHHLVYSAWPKDVGVFTRVRNSVVPLVFPTEPLSPLV